MGEPVAESYKIAIVGSGPAGLSAAARAAELGIAHVLLEKTDHLSDTIYKYQKGKHVMATPSQLVLRSDCSFEAGKREAVLGAWNEESEKYKVNVKLHAEVKAITGAKGDFTLKLTNGGEVKAEYIIMGIGTQGNPNLMRVPGGDLAHVQYSLDDPGEFVDEHITVIGAGDAGIENAVGLAQDPAQRNIVTILNRTADFSRAKDANVKLLFQMRDAGRVRVMGDTTPSKVEDGYLTLDTRDGEEKIRCDRIIARMGSAAPRSFVESCGAEMVDIESKGRDGSVRTSKGPRPGTGIEFTSPDREAYPKLSPEFESTVPGIYVIGALAGYPLIKHCMNQGYDVVEFINGNTSLKPADEPILEAKFRGLPRQRSVDDWLEFLRANVEILNGMSPLQMREFMLDSDVRAYRIGETVFEKDEPGSSLFGIALGSVEVAIPGRPGIRIGRGSIFGEVGLISGRRRGATIRASEDAIVVEISRTAALKLMASNPTAKKVVTRISTERQLLQMFGAGLTPDDLTDVVNSAEVQTVKAGQAILKEGETGLDIYVIRVGSMVVEKNVGGRPVFLSYLPAGLLCGRDGVDRRRQAHRDGARRDQERGHQARRRRVQERPRQEAGPFRKGEARDGGAPGRQCLHRGQEGQLLLRRRHVFERCQLPRRERHRRGDRRAADRREPLRRLRQLREGVRGQPRGAEPARSRGRAHLRAPSCPHLLPPLRASALHGGLPAQRDPSRAGRRGVSSRIPASAAAIANAIAPMA